MHITRKTNQELVVVDSIIWISVLFFCAVVPLTYQAVVQAKPKEFIVAGLFLVFGLLPLRRETVIFDAGQQQVRWKRLRVFKVATGTLPFSEIKGIGVEATSSDRRGLTYRLTILTSDKPVPMSDVYGNSDKHYESLKAEILQFLHLEDAEAPSQASPGTADDAGLRSLLSQGRKIDAIQMLRRAEKLSLIEAVQRIDQIDEKMKAAQ